MAKKTSKAEKEKKQARALLDIILTGKKGDLQIHCEARGMEFPQPGDFNAIDVYACKRNQRFLGFLTEELERVWNEIDAREKQRELPLADREEELKSELLGEPEPLGPTPVKA